MVSTRIAAISSCLWFNFARVRDAIAMVARRINEVNVEELADGRILITGGALVGGMAWIPDPELIVELGDQKLIQLRQVDRGLMAVVGNLRCRHNGFLDDLARNRALACGAHLDTLVRGSQDLMRASAAKMTRARATFLAENEEKLPSTIDVPVAGAPHNKICVKFEHDARKVIAVALTSETMTFVCERVRATRGQGERKRQRVKVPSHKYAYPEIKWDDKREVMFVRYRNEDGAMRYRSKAVPDIASDVSDESEAERTLERESVEELHKFYVEHHCEPVANAEPDDEDHMADARDGAVENADTPQD
jgi:hypothetical protein